MKIKMKINYNGFVDLVMETVASENIEQVQENAIGIEAGISILGKYMEEISEHTIETEDPWLVEWCKNLMIIKEEEHG